MATAHKPAHKPASTAPEVQVGPTLRVRATARGYDNIAVRDPGDEFDLPVSVVEKTPKDAAWFEVIED